MLVSSMRLELQLIQVHILKIFAKVICYFSDERGSMAHLIPSFMWQSMMIAVATSTALEWYKKTASIPLGAISMRIG